MSHSQMLKEMEQERWLFDLHILFLNLKPFFQAQYIDLRTKYPLALKYKFKWEAGRAASGEALIY